MVSSCRDQHGFTPIHYACMYGYPNIIEAFFVRGAKADIVNMGGDSLLHVASQHGKYDAVVKVSNIVHDCVISLTPIYKIGELINAINEVCGHFNVLTSV